MIATESNRTLANDNLAHQPELEQQKKELAELYSQLDALENEYQQKQQELQSKRGLDQFKCREV